MPRLSPEAIQERLAKAKARELKARQQVAKLKRAMSKTDRRADTQRKCAIGGLVLELAKRGSTSDVHLVTCLRTYPEEHPTHWSNKEVLRGTALDLEISWPPTALTAPSTKNMA